MKDSNFVDTAMAYNGSSVVPLQVMPTGELIINVFATATATTAVNGNAVRDANFVPVSLAIDDNGIISPLLTNQNGYLSVKF